MTKKEFIRKFAEKLNISQKEAGHIVDLHLETIEEALKEGDLSFVGWGSYKVVTREEREGRNPQTGSPIKIPSKKVIKFKAGSLLEERINKRKGASKPSSPAKSSHSSKSTPSKKK